MNKKIYKTVNLLLQFLSSAEDSWSANSTVMSRSEKALKQALARAGISGTDEEVCETLMRFVATIATKQDSQQDNYPVINYTES